MKSRICMFYARDGFCADGEHCDFVHEERWNAPVVAAPAPCKFYNSDKGCMYGDMCMYLHAKPSTSYASVVTTCQRGTAESHLKTETLAASGQAKQAPVCKFYLSGSCAYGSRCRYSHDRGIGASSDCTIADIDLECGICMNKIDGCQIGMLSHCNCLFCLNCIRNWRKDGLEIAGPSQVRLCPLCRKESHFTIPTYARITDPDIKAAIIQEYRHNISNTPCKYFSAQFEYKCPFGSSCFYKHVDESGMEVEKEAPRLLVVSKPTGESAIESAKQGVSLSDFMTTLSIGNKSTGPKKKR